MSYPFKRHFKLSNISLLQHFFSPDEHRCRSIFIGNMKYETNITFSAFWLIRIDIDTFFYKVYDTSTHLNVEFTAISSATLRFDITDIFTANSPIHSAIHYDIRVYRFQNLKTVHTPFLSMIVVLMIAFCFATDYMCLHRWLLTAQLCGGCALLHRCGATTVDISNFEYSKFSMRWYHSIADLNTFSTCMPILEEIQTLKVEKAWKL